LNMGVPPDSGSVRFMPSQPSGSPPCWGQAPMPGAGPHAGGRPPCLPLRTTPWHPTAYPIWAQVVQASGVGLPPVLAMRRDHYSTNSPHNIPNRFSRLYHTLIEIQRLTNHRVHNVHWHNQDPESRPVSNGSAPHRIRSSSRRQSR